MSALDFNPLDDIYFALCKSVDTPVALGAWLRYYYGEHAQLAAMELEPGDYCDAHAFRGDYLVVSYIAKYKGLRMEVDTKEAALQSFISSEHRCQTTNESFRGDWLQDFPPAVAGVLYTARRKISQVLGDFTMEWIDGCKWGPGATFSLKGAAATVDNKIGQVPMTITPAAVPLMRAVISSDVQWLRSLGYPVDGPCTPVDDLFEVVNGCRVTTVAKNAKTDRTIAIEPTANTFLQGGLGSYIRRRLRRVGVNLNDQTINQEMAQRGYAEAYATVDLQAASDSISRALVDVLLPPEWVSLIDTLRSPMARLPNGEWVILEKVSSMGNGFTFELESLIFWALSKATCEHHSESTRSSRVVVYGDDILVPSCVYPRLVTVFERCGFLINSKKSHYRTQFRESCGKHYFDGIDVSPIYQKEVPDVLAEAYRCCNRLHRLALEWGHRVICEPTLYGVWRCAVRVLASDRVPNRERVLDALKQPRHVVPLTSEDDGGLALPWSEAIQYCTGRTGWGGYKFRVLAFKPLRKLSSNERALLANYFRFAPCELDYKGLVDYAKRHTVSAPSLGMVTISRRGRYVSRRRAFHVGCDTPWAL